MLQNDELDHFLQPLDKPPQKAKKNVKHNIEEKNIYHTINQHSYLFSRILYLQENRKLSSKHNSSKNLLFNTLPNNISNEKFKILKNYDNTLINSTLDMFKMKPSNNHTSGNTLSNTIGNPNSYTSPQRMPVLTNANKLKDLEKELLFSDRKLEDLSINSLNKNIIRQDHENDREEKILLNKVKEIKNKKHVKGLTSIFINRENRKILVNSMSHSQYFYDAAFMDKQAPIELKGHKSSFYVKSVLSPNSDYVLSGSLDASIYIWDTRVNKLENNLNSNPIKLTGFHTMEVNAVDWSRDNEYFIASASDDGIILLWDDK